MDTDKKARKNYEFLKLQAAIMEYDRLIHGGRPEGYFNLDRQFIPLFAFRCCVGQHRISHYRSVRHIAIKNGIRPVELRRALKKGIPEAMQTDLLLY